MSVEGELIMSRIGVGVQEENAWKSARKNVNKGAERGIFQAEAVDGITWLVFLLGRLSQHVHSEGSPSTCAACWRFFLVQYPDRRGPYGVE